MIISIIFVGIGMDSAVIPLRNKDLYLVQSVDYFYPLVDDPYILGKIALANVISDVYAVGVTTIDSIRLILSATTEFEDEERDVVIPLIIKGFKDLAREAGTDVQIGNIGLNPWCIIGGIATAVCTKEEIIM